MDDEANKMLRDMRDRLVRVESRVVQLGDYVGANLRTKARVEIRFDGDECVVEIDTMDMSVGRIFTTFQQERVQVDRATLVCNGTRLGVLEFGPVGALREPS